MSKITEVKARQVLDCKGRPVAEVDVVTESGFLGRAGASTGSSVGANESFVLRDGDPGIYGGMSVYKAIANIREVLAPAILGMDVQDQEAIDRKMIALDGTRYKTNLGGNAIYAVSVAVAKAAAAENHLPIYRNLAAGPIPYLMSPSSNVINGGTSVSYTHLDVYKRQVFSTVEPEDMACIYKSSLAADGEPHAVEGDCATIMAGLNCGEPCTVTWPVLRTFTSFAFSCADPVAALGMRLLAAPRKGDHPIVSGESGAATTGLLAVLAASPEFAGLRREMGLDSDSVVLLFSTEGDTDPEQYRSIVYAGKHALQ